MKKSPIKTCLIVDPNGSFVLDVTGSQEIAEHKKYYGRLLRPRKLECTEKLYVSDAMDADLVIFDFGGMGFGNDLLGSNSRTLARWLKDHPSSLVIVASSFTYRNGLGPELRELGLYVPDSEPMDSYDRQPDMYDRPKNEPIFNLCVQDKFEGAFEAKVKRWFR